MNVSATVTSETGRKWSELVFFKITSALSFTCNWLVSFISIIENWRVEETRCFQGQDSELHITLS